MNDAIELIWTIIPRLKVGNVIHALQGNGPGNKGLYARGRTWCDHILTRIPKSAEETLQNMTCEDCIRVLRNHDITDEDISPYRIYKFSLSISLGSTGLKSTTPFSVKFEHFAALDCGTDMVRKIAEGICETVRHGPATGTLIVRRTKLGVEVGKKIYNGKF